MHPFPTWPGYDPLQRLGGGPTAETYLARQAGVDRLCVVKCLRHDSDDHALTLLRREARAALAVQHRSLVRLIDAHVMTAPHFLAFEHLPGETLRERLRREFTLDLRLAIWVARQLAEALTALHRAGYVHADVKPENVILAPTGQATLIDLGFAHKPSRSAGGVMGTPDYFAPELCDLATAPGQPADWFAFGLMMWESLAGRLPDGTGGMAERLAERRTHDLRERLPKSGPDWPSRLVDLLAMLLDPRPTGRPAGRLVVGELVALEIAGLGGRRAA